MKNDAKAGETVAVKAKGKAGSRGKKFLARLKEASTNGVTLIVIREPQELGETYEEVIASLNRLAAMDMNLAVLPQEARD